MKVLNSGTNKKALEKDLNMIEARFAEGMHKTNSLKSKLQKC